MKKTVEEIIEELGYLGHSVWCDKWHDQWGHWRVALDWQGGEVGQYLFICEKPTLLEAVETALDYAKNPKKYV